MPSSPAAFAFLPAGELSVASLLVDEPEKDALMYLSRCYLTSDRAYVISVTSKPLQADPGLQPIENNSPPIEARSQTMTTFLNSVEILE
jgi:hypothetical protein